MYVRTQARLCPEPNGLNEGQKIPRAHLVLKQQLIWINLRGGEARGDELASSIKSRKSAHGWEKIYTHTKHNNPHVTALRTQLLPQQTQVLRRGLISLPLFQVFPPPAIHICRPCARLPGGHPCWTQGVGPEPKMGIYQPTSALPEINASVGQDCVVLVTCGGDPTPRRGGGGTNSKRKDIYSLSFNRAVRGSSSLRLQASVFMLKGNTNAYKPQLCRW